MSANRPPRLISLLACLGLLIGLLAAAGCASSGAPAGSAMRGLNKDEAQELLAKQKAARDEQYKKNLEAPDPEKLEAQGDRLALVGDWMASLLQYSRALSLANKKDHYRLKTKMAEACLRDRQFVQAEAIFKELSKKKPGNAINYQGMGLAYFGQGREQEAFDALQRAAKIDSTLWRTHSALGILYNQRKQPQKAIASFKAAIKLQPSAPSLYNNLGMAYFLADDLVRAERAFQRAVRLNPNFKLAHNNLGVVLLRQNRLREAQEHFETATSASQAHNNLGVLLAWQGQPRKAAQQFREAIDSMPRYYPKATRHLEQIKRTDPGLRQPPILDISEMILPIQGDVIQDKPVPRTTPPPASPKYDGSGQSGQGPAVGAKSLGTEQHKADRVKGIRISQDDFFYSGQGNGSGLVQGVAVNAGGQAGEGHAAQAVAGGQLQGAPVGRSQKPGVLGIAAVDRPHGVDHVLGGQAPGGSDHRLTGGAAAQTAGLGLDIRPAGAVNSPVHSTARDQAAVGRVDNGVGGHRGDVSINQGKTGVADGEVGHGSASSLGSGSQKEKPSFILHASGHFSGQRAGAVEKVQTAGTADGSAGVLVEHQAHKGSDAAVWRRGLSLDETHSQAGENAAVGGDAAASGKRNLIAAQRPASSVQGAEKDITGVVTQNTPQVFGVLGQKGLNGLH
jgi:tetratricopeptide (TPR) repeat protein